MKRIVLALTFAAAAAVPVYAQDAPSMEELVCSEYNAMDNAGKNAIVAELQSEAGGMDVREDVSADEIFTHLAAGCVGAPEVLVVEVFKEIK